MGLIGDGGTITLSSTVSSSTPALVADYQQGTSLFPVDGPPVNCYTISNSDSTNASIVWVNYTGMAATKFVPVSFGYPFTFQKGAITDEITFVKAYGTTVAGVAAAVPISGAVVSRRR